MELEKGQTDLKKNITEILETIPELERKGVDESLIKEQLQIAEKLSKFSDKLTPIIEDSKNRGIHSHSSRKYREVANAYPRIKKTVILFLVLCISSLVTVAAIEGGVFFLEPLKSYSNLFKSMTWFLLAPVLLTVSLIAYITKAFPGRYSHRWIEKNEQPIKYWLLMLLWPTASIGSIFLAWYWLKAYLNA